MRNPDRLDVFYNTLCEIHKKIVPDWRVGQMFGNFFGWLMSEKKIDYFFLEEDRLMIYLSEFLDTCLISSAQGEREG